MPTNLRHHRIHLLQPIHTTSVTSIHLGNIQHLATVPHVDPGPNAIDPRPGDMTNDQSPSLGALVVEDPQEDSVAPHDLDFPPETFPSQGMLHVSQAEPRPSPYAQPLHNDEKNDIVNKITNHYANEPIHQLLFNLHRGNTTHNSLPTTNTQSHSYHYDQSSTNKWESWGQWKDYSNSSNSPK